MSPGQAADILSILPLPEAEAIMKSMAKENVLKIDEILRQHHENIVNFSTRKFLSYPPDETFSQAHESYLQVAEGQIVVTYLHIIDSTETIGCHRHKRTVTGTTKNNNKTRKHHDNQRDDTLKTDSALKETSAIFFYIRFPSITSS